MRGLCLRATPWVALLLLVSACSTVPYSDRTRVLLTSESEEMALGAAVYEEILEEATLSTDAAQVAMLRRVGRRVADVADRVMEAEGRTPFEWEFNLIDEDTVNAFVLPGGKVAFFSGILPICANENGVAVIMGHEVAHALARHGGERMSQAGVLNAIAGGIAALSTGKESKQEDIAAAINVGFNVFFGLPFSRKHELEADFIGLMLMAEAGYDPREAPRFWERMREASGGQEPPAFLSTHPPSSERIERLNAAMHEALQYYEGATGERLDPGSFTLTAE